MIVYPGWWKGGRWDIERLLRDLFTFQENGAARGLSGVQVEPLSTLGNIRREHLADGNGYLLVHRNGGHVNKSKQQWTDETITTIAALTASRDESLRLQEYVTDVFCEFDEGGHVHRSTPHLSGAATTFMTVPGEVVGPQLVPEQLRDERLVPATWHIHADRPRGLPDYRDHLDLDW